MKLEHYHCGLHPAPAAVPELGRYRHSHAEHIMRMQHLLPLVGFMAGCSSTATRTDALTPDKAGSLAQQLANQEAQSLYHCQPFYKAEPAQFVEGHWVWHQMQGQGRGDVEAKVEFKADGADPKVSVTQLDSLPILR